jgi:hypothetical protein
MPEKCDAVGSASSFSGFLSHPTPLKLQVSAHADKRKVLFDDAAKRSQRIGLKYMLKLNMSQSFDQQRELCGLNGANRRLPSTDSMSFCDGSKHSFENAKDNDSSQNLDRRLNSVG